MAESETEQVISNLRACLLSMKGGIPINNLDRDYKILIGHSIPYRRLGFDTLEQFLRSIPNVSISKKNGDIVLDAIPSKNTEHLAALIARQKSAPKKIKPPPRSVGQRRTAAMQWRPPPSAFRWAKVPRRAVLPSKQLSVSVNTSRNRSNKQNRQVSSNVVSNHSLSNLQNCATPSVPPAPAPAPIPALASAPIPVSETIRITKTASPRKAEIVLQTNSQILSIPSSLADNGPVSQQKIITQETINENINTELARLAIRPSLSPLQARLRNLAKRNPQVPSVMTIESQFLEALIKNTPQDYSSELQHVSEALGLGMPTYKIVPRVPKGEPVMYSCIVKVGEQNYNSFPDEHTIPGEAVQLAAKRALTELKKKGSGESLPVTSDQQIVMTRVTLIVQAHPSGIWGSQIPVDYSSQFQETLPDDWLKVIRSSCSSICVEHVAGNRVILSPNNFVSNSDIQPTSVVWRPVQMYVPIPELITLPSEDVWDVYVTCALTTTEVWIRLIGQEYSIRYEAMATDMEIFYMENKKVALNYELGYYYAIQLDGCWHRVLLSEIMSQDGLVFFVDHGDEDTFPLSMLHVLEPSFAQLPSQAVHVCLSGLEDFANDPNATKHLVDTVIGKTLVAEVIARSHNGDPSTSVVLYDTSTEEDINVNRLLAERISQDALAPQLPEGGEIREVYLSYVNEEGDVFLHIRSESFSYLQTLMDKLMEVSIHQDHVTRLKQCEIDPTKLYLARYSVDYQWYRAIVTSELDDKSEVVVQFVDYGNTEKIPSSNLLLLGELSGTLETFPHQAIRVHLHNVPPEAFTSKMAERIRELVTEDEPVLVKVVQSSKNSSPPQVEMFKRTEDKQLVSINNTLALDPELMKPKAKENEPRQRRRTHGQRPHILEHHVAHRSHEFDLGQGDHPRGLGIPAIPDIGQYFDVHVTMAANPSNFTVQPFRERSHLENLMKEMQEFYGEKTGEPVMPDAVKEGDLFAARHHDNYWYRVSVSNVINGNTVSVYFCDFGDVTILSLDRLQQLGSQFRQLPAQAIKAKLARIVPSHSDWSVEDCIRFQERVVEQQFVSVIIDSGPDLLNPSDIVLGLHLFDTNGPVDVDIDQMLVDEKRAIYTPTIQVQLQQNNPQQMQHYPGGNQDNNAYPLGQVHANPLHLQDPLQQSRSSSTYG